MIVQFQQRTHMLEDKVTSLFKNSTEMYCQGKYQACLALLSDCLTLESDKSILYSNRSIAYYHLKQLQNSFQDLELALRANHLNYIAYFNIFSLYYLNGNHQESFKNLCLSLSSAYTILCRCQSSLEWVEQSIFYSFNNKESLFLKAILLYEKSQPRTSLQILKKVCNLENNLQNRKNIIRFIHSIQTQLKLQKSQDLYRQITNQWYVLDTDVPQPSSQIFENQIGKMLKEFNEVYRKINDEMQINHELKENSNSQISEGNKNLIGEDKQVNQITTHTSNAYSRNEQEDLKSFLQSSLHKELKLLSLIVEQNKNNKQSQKSETPLSDEAGSLKQVHKKIKFFIQSAKLSKTPLIEDTQRKPNIYAILFFKQGNSWFTHRTSVVSNVQNLKWCQWTYSLDLNQETCELVVKILNKRYTVFKDDLLAEGHISITKRGAFSIPLFHNKENLGFLQISAKTQ